MRDKWGISCVTCARVGVLWFRCCQSPEQVVSIIESHSWPCPSEPDPGVDAASTQALLDAGVIQIPQWIIDRYSQH